jgi:hypothetical protein
MFLMPTRFALIIIDVILITILVSIFSIGHDFKKGPLQNGCRKSVIFFIYELGCSFFLFVVGMRTKVKKENADYSYYLGQNYL